MDLIKLLQRMDAKLTDMVGTSEEAYLGGKESYTQFENYYYKFIDVMQRVYKKANERFPDNQFLRERGLRWEERFYLGIPDFNNFDDRGM